MVRDEDRPRRPRRRKVKDSHSQGLAEEIEAPENNGVRVNPHAKKRKRAGEDQERNEVLDAKLTGRILKAAREQQEEVDAEAVETQLQASLGTGTSARLGAGALAAALQRAADSDDDEDSDDSDAGVVRGAARGPAVKGGDARMRGSKAAAAKQKPRGLRGDDDDDDEEDELDLELRTRTLKATAGAGEGAGEGDDGLVAEVEEEVSPEDEAALAAFMAPGASTFQQLSLGDLILSKLKEQQAQRGMDTMAEDGEEEPLPEGLDDKVVAVYRGVGKLLSRYKVGKVPKAFKIIPNLKNWEEVLWLTDPDLWTPHAMYEATKLFVSSLNARLAQRFLALVLLPRVRREIKKNQKLHLALFMALRKATYKPGAFYKGILLPLCASRTCSLREAVILTSVLKRTSIPVLHSSAALMRMAELEYCGTTSFFMRVLLDKKYALPYRVIDGLVDHFVRFADDERSMPVVWHQTLLCFVQRYKDEIRPQDKDALRKLCQAQSHYLVTPEVLRELDHSRGQRGAPGTKSSSFFAPATGGATGGGGGLSSWAAGANFVVGSKAAGAGAAAGPGGARVFGAATFAARPQVAVIGKNVSENVRSMPPVMMLD